MEGPTTPVLQPTRSFISYANFKNKTPTSWKGLYTTYSYGTTDSTYNSIPPFWRPVSQKKKQTNTTSAI